MMGALRDMLFVVVYLALLTDPLRIQPWQQDRRDQTKSSQEESRRKKRTRKQPAKDIVARKGHRRDKNIKKKCGFVRRLLKRKSVLSHIIYRVMCI